MIGAGRHKCPWSDRERAELLRRWQEAVLPPRRRRPYEAIAKALSRTPEAVREAVVKLRAKLGPDLVPHVRPDLVNCGRRQEQECDREDIAARKRAIDAANAKWFRRGHTTVPPHEFYMVEFKKRGLVL